MVFLSKKSIADTHIVFENMSIFCKYLYQVLNHNAFINREGGEIELFITVVPKVLKIRYPIRWIFWVFY